MNFSLILYIGIALQLGIGTILSSVEAGQFIDPQMLFVLRSVNALFGSVVVVLKGYTSSGFQTWQAGRKKNGDTPMENRLP